MQDTTLSFSGLYPEDVDVYIVKEIIHVREFVMTDGGENPKIGNLCQSLLDSDRVDVISNEHEVPRIYKTMAVINCCPGSSCPCLKHIKSYLRSSMSEGQLRDRAILNIESTIVESIPFERIIVEFCDKKFRLQWIKQVF